VPIIVTLVVSELSKSIGQDQVMSALASPPSDYQIRVNGKPVKNRDELPAVLKKLHWVFPHHSRPTRRIDVEVSNRPQPLVLWICRDSDDPREYWVFYPKYLITAYSEVGRLVTPIFDGY
jgi:hypothetical protein